MIPPQEALDRILGRMKPLSGENVKLEETVGRVLDEDIIAVDDLPPFRNSAMDGFAVRTDDTDVASHDHPVSLLVRDIVPAGAIAVEKLGPGETIKVMTGSPLPTGTDGVVMKERVRETADGRIEIFQAVHTGENVRDRGEDVRSGDLLLPAGSLIRPYEVALLAAQGISGIRVVRVPRIAFLTTGDELLDISQPLSPGKIRNSNGPTIACVLRRWGVEALDLGIGRDDPEELEMTIREVLAGIDLLLISGGVSVGDFDYTHAVLKKLELRQIFWKVAIKPGKPLMFGVIPVDSDRNGSEVPVFGLPGNPVSVMICLQEFVRPAVERMRGLVPKYPSYHLKGTVENEFVTPEERQQYLFCRVSGGNEDFRIEIIRPQGSAMMGMACRANALAVAPVGLGIVKAGDVLDFRWLK
jgi:molybdopterin molybdotransferase